MSGPRALVVEAARAPVLVEDLGRPGHAHAGVGRSGAADRAALRLAGRLVGGRGGEAALEVLLGGVALRACGHLVVAVTGADVPVAVDGREAATHAPVDVPDGGLLVLGPARRGLRAYVAVRGGIAAEPVLGSRSRDTLSGLGPSPLRPGDAVPVGPAPGALVTVDQVPLPRDRSGPLEVAAAPGPRADWLAADALETFFATQWTVDAASDRVGTRLVGPALPWAAGAGELPSEGVVRGAVQVPPSGRPVVLGADHPVTGGYPVLAVVADADCDALGQVRPGERLRFRPMVEIR